jgi:mannose-1-phosphate guanylyltransferase
MKIIIFAGGVGTRLWPLSRENSPKQFDKMFLGKSTLQLAIERVEPAFGISNIFIQTLEKYKPIVLEQITDLPAENIIVEPERRNLGPAVCLAMIKLNQLGYEGAVSLLWADHLMDKVEEFTGALKIANELIDAKAERFIFLAERPRFANNNLGWINVGGVQGTIDGRDYYEFKGWKYKPSVEECDHMYRSGEYFWNPGYFTTSIKFLLEKYQLLAPDIFQAVMSGQYGQAKSIHFDKAIIEKVDLSDAVILKTNMGWSDPGTLYALKEALEETKEANVTNGLVSLLDTNDCLVYNMQDKKLIAAIGLKGMVIVNTQDALIAVPKDDVIKITQLINQLKEEGRQSYL